MTTEPASASSDNRRRDEHLAEIVRHWDDYALNSMLEGHRVTLKMYEHNLVTQQRIVAALEHEKASREAAS